MYATESFIVSTGVSSSVSIHSDVSIPTALSSTPRMPQKMSRHAGMHLLHFLLPEQVRRHDGCADVAAKRDGDENQRDFGAVADSGKRLCADEMPRNKAVRDVVELLEDDAAWKELVDTAEELIQNSSSDLSQEVILETVRQLEYLAKRRRSGWRG